MRYKTFADYVIYVHDFFDEIGLDHFLIGSNLLGYYRGKKLLKDDTEVNFGVMADDIGEKMDAIKKQFRVVRIGSSSRVESTFLYSNYIGQDSLPKDDGWRAFIPPFFESNHVVVEAPGQSHLLWWPKEYLKPFGKVRFLNRTFNVPRQPRRWLRHYFGPGWKVRDKNWHWLKDARNHLDLEDLC